MTTNTFTESDLREVLANWPKSHSLLNKPTTSNIDGILDRVRKCLLDLVVVNQRSTYLDLILLIRHFLLEQAKGTSAPWIQVSVSNPWPGSELWRSHDYEVADYGRTARVRPLYPRIGWLGSQMDLLDDVFNCVESRFTTKVPSDSVLRTSIGLPSYTGPGQREAIRALVHLPKEITLIANLPTGSGKSLLAQLPPLFNSDRSLTLVVVPTVALAIDQGRRMVELMRQRYPGWLVRPLSFHSGLTSSERSEIFHGINTGEQRILFTSPESATGSLRGPLIQCAKNGGISHVVIDEAHLVVTWGSGFRPSFQLLPGFISSLRRANLQEENSPIKVVLASATLTSHTITSLEKLFSRRDGVAVVSGVFLRPEIRYAVKKSQSYERDNFVIEAVLKAPRPYILYVTRPEEADYWLGVLNKNGIGRIACFTGETSPLQRKNLLTAWEENQLDGMIATSAFGLGVDKSDVRTVIHATLPESLDRFYQEVGRSGRDGKASASILIFSEDDVTQARDISSPKLIGNELGYERWIAMLDDPMRQNTNDGKQWLNLNRLRAGLSVQGKKNLAWNLRTLNLMATAGLIEIDDLSAVISNESLVSSDIDYSDSQIQYASVRVLHPEHRDRDFYEQSMNSARNAMQDASSKAFQLMHKVAKLEIEVSEALVALYGLSLLGHWSDVESNCGGCKFHWNENRLPQRKLIPFVSRIDKFTSRINNWPELTELPKEQKNLIFIAVNEISRYLISDRSVLLLMIQKVRPHSLIVSSKLSDSVFEKLVSNLVKFKSDTFIDRANFSSSNEISGGHDEIRFIVWDEQSISRNFVESLRASECAMTVVFVDSLLSDPYREDRKWLSVLNHADELTIIRRISE